MWGVGVIGGVVLQILRPSSQVGGVVKCSLGPGFELPGGESLHLQVQAVCHHGTVAPHDPARQGGGGDGGDLAVEHV